MKALKARSRTTRRRSPVIPPAQSPRSVSARRCCTRRAPPDAPKGILRPLPELSPAEGLPLFHFLNNLWQYREDMIYLSPAPLYHSAPQAAVGLTLRNGGTVVIMERFDPADYLRLIEQYSVSHSQLVPTMFSRLLKLPEDERNRYDVSSLEIAVHAAAPCPVQVKHEMIEWWGPIIHEYYGATEGLGFTACNSEEWLAHPGTVGKVILGELHILDDDMNELPPGEPGTIWFETATEFSYHNDPEKTQEATSPDGAMTTVNDIGYVDDDGFLHLTDRRTFMIISGGVNLYPQETEDVLITHPKVFDAAVFGVTQSGLGRRDEGCRAGHARCRRRRSAHRGAAQLLPRAPVSAEGASFDRFRR